MDAQSEGHTFHEENGSLGARSLSICQHQSKRQCPCRQQIRAKWQGGALLHPRGGDPRQAAQTPWQRRAEEASVGMTHYINAYVAVSLCKLDEWRSEDAYTTRQSVPRRTRLSQHVQVAQALLCTQKAMGMQIFGPLGEEASGRGPSDFFARRISEHGRSSFYRARLPFDSSGSTLSGDSLFSGPSKQSLAHPPVTCCPLDCESVKNTKNRGARGGSCACTKNPCNFFLCHC